MPAVDIDDDTAQAVINLWTKTSVLDAVATSPPGPGRVKKPPGDKPSIRFPYSSMTVKKGKENQRMTGGVYHDFREVTLQVIGTKAQASAAIAAMRSVFGLQLGIAGQPTLTLPSGARFIQWWPLDDGSLTQDPTTKEGQDVWLGTVRGQVWSVRTDTGA